MIGNSDELFAKQLLTMPCLEKTNNLNIEALRGNSPSLKSILDEEKNIEKYCTDKVFKHVMSKKNLFESKNCKSLIRAGVPLKYLSDLLIKLFNNSSDTGEGCSAEIQNYNTNRLIALKSHDAKNFLDYVPYFSGYKTLKESLPVNYLNASGVLKLKEILWMINALNSNIEFSPIIIKLTSLLLLVCSEAETFAIIKSLIDLNSKVQNTSKIRWHIRFSYSDNRKIVGSICESLIDISNKSGKETFNHFENISFPAEKLFEDMVFGFFTEYLSFSGVMRLLPFFLLEGVKSLYRMCYAIVKTLRLNILAIQSPDEVIKTVRAKAREITDFNKLFNLAFGYKLTSKNNKYDFQKPLERDVFATRRNSYYLPAFSPSGIISETEFITMWSMLPEYLRAKDAKLVFDPEKHGYSIKNLYNIATENEESSAIIFLLKTQQDEVFGGYVSNMFKYTGEKFTKPFDAFLIRIRPQILVYPVGKKAYENVLLCNNDYIMFGNGEYGPAIYIVGDFGSGRSNCKNCFCEEKLVESEDGNFKIAKFEVYLLA